MAQVGPSQHPGKVAHDGVPLLAVAVIVIAVGAGGNLEGRRFLRRPEVADGEEERLVAPVVMHQSTSLRWGRCARLRQKAATCLSSGPAIQCKRAQPGAPTFQGRSPRSPECESGGLNFLRGPTPCRRPAERATSGEGTVTSDYTVVRIQFQ